MNRHERTDLDPKYVLYFAIVLVIAGLLIYVGTKWMFWQFQSQQARQEMQPSVLQVPKPIPEPHLQISPQGDLEELRRQEDEILSTYQWIDRDQGTARIPIDRAMELFLERQKK